MRLFKHKPEKVQEPKEGDAVHKSAQVIARVILDWQNKAACLLNSKFKSLPRRTQQVYLLLYCLLFGGYSFGLLLQALWPEHGEIPHRSFTTHPQYPTESLRKEASSPPALYLQERLRLQRIREGLDVLSQAAEGRHSRDSLLLTRPGLQDSIPTLNQPHSKDTPYFKTK